MEMNHTGEQSVVRPIPEAELKRYFTFSLPSPLTVVMVGVLSLGFPGLLLLFWPVQLVLALCLPFLLLIWIWLAFASRRPRLTDQEYDAWLRVQYDKLLSLALLELGLDSDTAIGRLLRIHSGMLPGMEATGTPQQRACYARKGCDEQWRCSEYSYLFLFPEENYLAVFKGSINAFSQEVYDERRSEYVYTDVIGAFTESECTTVTYQGNEYPYQITRFQIHFSTAEVSIPVEAVSVKKQLYLPALSSMEEVDIAIPHLRLLLREKKGETI